MNKRAKHRYQVLDSLRGICACMVVLYHFHTVGWISNLALVRNSWLFVDFFFVLSGFVITMAYRAKIAAGLTMGSFMWLRMGRIYPVHLFVLGLFLAIQLALLARGGMGAAFHKDMTVGGFFSCLTLTNAFFTSNGVGWNGPSWSIAVEMWTYLAFAAVFRFCKSRQHLAVSCVILAILSCGYIAVFYGGNMHSFYFAALFRCVYGFSLGVLGAEFFPVLMRKWGSPGTVAELAAVTLVTILITVAGTGPFSMLMPPVFLAMILIFANEGGLISSALNTKIPLLLGELSYSIYMIHLFVIYRISGLIDVMHAGQSGSFVWCDSGYCGGSHYALLADALIVPLIAAVVAAAYLLRRYIEVPCERWARNQLSRRMLAASGSSSGFGATT